MRTIQTLLLCSLACLSLACVSAGGPAGYAPPAWREPGLIPFHYGLTRKAITAARGPSPRLIVRIAHEQSEKPSLLWARIPAAVSSPRKWNDLPFLPTPSLPIVLPAELENCSAFEVFVNPTGAQADPFDSQRDAIVIPMGGDGVAPLRASECQLLVFYGTRPERDGAWLQLASNQGIFSERMIVEPRPGFWALVPLAAIGETAYNAAVSLVVLFAIAGMGAGGAGGH